MHRLADLIRTRILPATFTALGVALVTGGLLAWTDPTVAGAPTGSPSAVVQTPLPTPRPATPAPSRPPGSGAPSPSAGPTVPPDRTASRVAVPALGIDLPVIRPPNDDYPVCDVALFLEELGQPGEGRAIYVYAHARTGMFLPLLEASLVRDGASMLGMVVQVWTTDEQLFLYEITEVRRHQLDLNDAVAADHEQLWLQTSEGPRDPSGRLTPKLQVVAEPLSNGPAPDPQDAHPTAEPRVCA